MSPVFSRRSCSNLNAPCPSCAFHFEECEYDSEGRLVNPLFLAIGVKCSELSAVSMAFATPARFGPDAVKCAEDFDSHSNRIIPDPCPAIACGACCFEATTRFVIPGCPDRVVEHPSGQEEGCRDIACNNCIFDCADIPDVNTPFFTSTCTGDASHTFVHTEARHTGFSAQAGCDAKLLYLDYTAIRDRTWTCSEPCSTCVNVVPGQGCREYQDNNPCNASGVCCIGSIGNRTCREVPSANDCRMRGGKFLVTKTGCEGIDATNRCNHTPRCDSADNCNACNLVEVDPSGVMPPGTFPGQLSCVRGQCNLGTMQAPGCARATFFMAEGGERTDDAIADGADPSGVFRENGQYNFGPAAFGLDHHHKFEHAEIDRISNAYGLPVVDGTTGYAYIEFRGFNRFAAGDGVGGLCETYCADPVLPFRHPDAPDPQQYGEYMGEYVPLC